MCYTPTPPEAPALHPPPPACPAWLFVPLTAGRGESVSPSTAQSKVTAAATRSSSSLSSLSQKFSENKLTFSAVVLRKVTSFALTYFTSHRPPPCPRPRRTRRRGNVWSSVRRASPLNCARNEEVVIAGATRNSDVRQESGGADSTKLFHYSRLTDPGWPRRL